MSTSTTKVVLPVGHGPNGGVIPISEELRRKLKGDGVLIIDETAAGKDVVRLTIGDIACLESGRDIQECIAWRRQHHPERIDFDPYGGVLSAAEVNDALTHGKPWREFPGDVA